MIARLISGTGFALLLATAAPAAAQALSIHPTSATYQSSAELRLAAGVVAPVAEGEHGLSRLGSNGRRGEGTALMIVGGAGILTGIIVDESIVTIAGAGVAGVGLYFFLDSGGKVTVGAR